MSEGSDFPEWKERIALNVICVLITHGAYQINGSRNVSTFSKSLTVTKFDENQNRYILYTLCSTGNYCNDQRLSYTTLLNRDI